MVWCRLDNKFYGLFIHVILQYDKINIYILHKLYSFRTLLSIHLDFFVLFFNRKLYIQRAFRNICWLRKEKSSNTFILPRNKYLYKVFLFSYFYILPEISWRNLFWILFKTFFYKFICYWYFAFWNVYLLGKFDCNIKSKILWSKYDEHIMIIHLLIARWCAFEWEKIRRQTNIYILKYKYKLYLRIKINV